MDNNPNKRLTATIIVNRVGYWLDEMNQGDNEIMKQILESDKVKPEQVELKHPNDYYSSKLMNTTQFDSKMQDLAISNSVDDSNS